MKAPCPALPFPYSYVLRLPSPFVPFHGPGVTDADKLNDEGPKYLHIKQETGPAFQEPGRGGGNG